MSTLFFLIGPTASGKSALALDWARRTGAELLYCDAFCVYRGMDIGTAKPDRGERESVPHHGIDLAEVAEPFSVADYAAEARRVVADAEKRGVPLMVTGGSGFYLKSFFEPVLDETFVPEEIVARVEALQASGGAAALLDELAKVAGGPIEGLDIQNPRRVRKALERCLATGRPLAELQAGYRAMPRPFPNVEKRIALIVRERGELDTRIERRARAMIAAGLVDEVRALLAKGLRANRSAASAIGYREVIAWLDAGENGGTDALAQEIAANTRKLVKKQLSFFRNQLPPAGLVCLRGDEPTPQLFA